MCETQILVGELPKEIDAAHAICQHMKYLKIYSVLIVCHPEKIAVILVRSYKSARKCIFLMHLWCLFAIFLKIIPEYSHPKSHVKQTKLRKHYIQCLLQLFTVNLIS